MITNQRDIQKGRVHLSVTETDRLNSLMFLN